MYVSITIKDAAFVQKAWDILKQNGEIYMELAPSFFAALHGSLRDKFGINWMFTALK
jgi:PhnB protein